MYRYYTSSHGERGESGRYYRCVCDMRTEPNSKTLPPCATSHPTKLCCTLLSYAASYWATLLHPDLHAAPSGATLHPTELRCTFLCYTALSELGCSLLICCATLHHTELRCTILSYAAPYWATLHYTELRCTLLSYAAPYIAPKHPTELYRTLLSYTTPTLHYTCAVRWTFLYYCATSGLRCSLYLTGLDCAATCWIMLQLLIFAVL